MTTKPAPVSHTEALEAISTISLTEAQDLCTWAGLDHKGRFYVPPSRFEDIVSLYSLKNLKIMLFYLHDRKRRANIMTTIWDERIRTVESLIDGSWASFIDMKHNDFSDFVEQLDTERIQWAVEYLKNYAVTDTAKYRMDILEDILIERQVYTWSATVIDGTATRVDTSLTRRS